MRRGGRTHLENMSSSVSVPARGANDDLTLARLGGFVGAGGGLESGAGGGLESGVGGGLGGGAGGGLGGGAGGRARGGRAFDGGSAFLEEGASEGWVRARSALSCRIFNEVSSESSCFRFGCVSSLFSGSRDPRTVRTTVFTDPSTVLSEEARSGVMMKLRHKSKSPSPTTEDAMTRTITVVSDQAPTGGVELGGREGGGGCGGVGGGNDGGGGDGAPYRTRPVRVGSKAFSSGGLYMPPPGDNNVIKSYSISCCRCFMYSVAVSMSVDKAILHPNCVDVTSSRSSIGSVSFSPEKSLETATGWGQLSSRPLSIPKQKSGD